MKLLATSDLHLGRHSSLPFEESDPGLTASAHTWHRIVDLAIREDMDALLLSGDLVDQSNRFYEASAELEKGIRRLMDARIPVVMVSGNHDHEVLPELVQRLTADQPGRGTDRGTDRGTGRGTDKGPGRGSGREPGRGSGSSAAPDAPTSGTDSGSRAESEGDTEAGPLVHLLGRNGRWETRTITVRNGEQLQVTGWSFPEQQSRYSRNPMETYEPPPQSGLVSVGLLHCDVNQSDSVYAPVASTDFNGTGLDYWVLGHIHKQIVWRDSAPEVFYPGAPHPFDAGEAEAGIVRVLDTDAGSSVVPVAPIRYVTLKYEVADAPGSRMRGDFQDRLRMLAEDPAMRSDALQLLVLTVWCRGTASVLNRFLDVQKENEGEYITVGEDMRAVVRKWVEEPQVETDLEKLAENSNPAGLLASWILHIDRKQVSGVAPGGQDGGVAEYPEELRELLDACRDEYRTLAGHGVFKPVVDGGQVPSEPTDEMIEALFRTRAMTLLQTLITQAEDRK